MTKILPDLKRIKVTGQINNIRVTPWSYEGLRHRFKKDQSLHIAVSSLPPWDALQSIGDQKALWVQMEKLTIRNEFEGHLFIEHTFFPGFIFDKVSNPVGKSDRIDEILESYPHDYNFSTHAMRRFSRHGDDGFRATNELFLKMLRCKSVHGDGIGHRYKRMGLLMARLHYRAVNSIVGQGIYMNATKRAWWHRMTAKIEIGSY